MNDANRTVLIFGGAGFIGSNLAPCFLMRSGLARKPRRFPGGCRPAQIGNFTARGVDPAGGVREIRDLANSGKRRLTTTV